MRGMDIFQKPYCREISTMRGRPMRGLPVLSLKDQQSNEVNSYTAAHLRNYICILDQ